MQKHRATASKEIGLSKPILQRMAMPRNRWRRIVAPKDAGSIPVGHPTICRKSAGSDLFGRASVTTTVLQPVSQKTRPSQPRAYRHAGQHLILTVYGRTWFVLLLASRRWEIDHC